MSVDNLIKELKKLSNNKQKEFLSKLVPTIDKKNILGVKNPEIRLLAKEMFKKDEKSCIKYIHILPHKYLEEYILHTAMLECIKDYDVVVKETEKILPYIDNWATCDTYSPKIVRKHLDDYYKHIKKWCKSKKPYTIRMGIEHYMSFYLDDIHNHKEMYDIVSKLRFKSKYKYKKENAKECPDKYYVDMMIAWFFATALAKDYENAVKYMKGNKLEVWTHNMTIKKARESFRVSEKNKIELNKYIIKNN